MEMQAQPLQAQIQYRAGHAQQAGLKAAFKAVQHAQQQYGYGHQQSTRQQSSRRQQRPRQQTRQQQVPV